MEFTLSPIGLLHTPFSARQETPIQSIRSLAEGWIEVFPEYAPGLEGVAEFSHLILIYLLDRTPQQSSLQVEPFLDDHKHGVFATRYPERPNRIGLSVVELLTCEETTLTFRGADMFDHTPLLDIKPYVPDFDIHPATRVGWYARRAKA
jgi:tRNA-Thr(GGU) m(6)t(6)A37 methyltransferase TsaA